MLSPHVDVGIFLGVLLSAAVAASAVTVVVATAAVEAMAEQEVVAMGLVVPTRQCSTTSTIRLTRVADAAGG